MPSRVKISNIDGNPSLFFDGKPVSPVSIYIPRIDKEEIKRFAATGIHLYTFPMNLSQDETFQSFDRMVNDLVGADPQACFFPRVNVEPSKQWLHAHKGDIIRDAFDMECGRLSLASLSWLEKMGLVFTNFVRHMEKHHGNRIIGYFIVAGSDTTWFWGCGEDLDFCQAAINAFRNWAKRKYHDNLRALNASWLTKPKVAAFDNIMPPAVAERAKTDLADFKHPRRRRYVIDYYHFLHETVVERIIYFAKIVKQETAGDKLAGVFYGYPVELSGYQGAQQIQGSGQMATSNLLRCKQIDFISHPETYYDRALGGSDRTQGAIDSMLLHNKFFYYEVDTRTALTEVENSAYWNLKIPTMAGTIEVLKRNFSYALCKSSGLWWMELTGGAWYNDPRILATLRQTQKIYQKAVGKPGSSVAEIAVIVDEKAALFLGGTAHTLNTMVYYQVPQIARIGAPYDIYLWDDINRIRNYKFYLFLNTFNVDTPRMRSIHNKLRSNNGTAVWLYAPGILDGHKISIKNMARLTGIKIGCLNVRSNIRIKVTENSKHPIARGLGENFRFGGVGSNPSNKGFLVQDPNPDLQPVFYACDPEVTVLGIINEGNKPGLVFKECRGWNSLYSATGALPSVLLRNIARVAGVHIYNDAPDALYANSNWLAIHTLTEGPKVIRLPKPAVVTDAFSGKMVCNGKKEFAINPQKYSTCLYAVQRFRKFPA